MPAEGYNGKAASAHEEALGAIAPGELADFGENAMRRLLYVLAGAFAAWVSVATVLWLQGAGGGWAGWQHFRAAIGADSMLVLVLSDLTVFTLLALVWLVRGLRARGASAGEVTRA